MRNRLITLKRLKNIKKCTIVYTEHTLQRDIVKLYQAWYLGPLTEKATMFEVGKMIPQTNWDETLEQTIARIENEIVRRKGEAGRKDDLQLELMAIHGRNREILPPSKLKKPLAGWQMDWFG